MLLVFCSTALEAPVNGFLPPLLFAVVITVPATLVEPVLTTGFDVVFATSCVFFACKKPLAFVATGVNVDTTGLTAVLFDSAAL
ncbi:hypothetical protein SDC9_151824 [bioreactor metagenome]|uniref:Uncharacterized protein n=1 Tax=bioreactor metagenome TaxID=1076179 RepID=A0A645EVP5_9ZZZZ